MASAIDGAATCPHCGEKLVILMDEMGQRVYSQGEATFAVTPRFHDCPGGLAAYDADEAARAKENNTKTARQLILGLDIGKYSEYRFNSWQVSRSQEAARVLQIVREYVTATVEGRTKRWLWLSGPYGTGKTHLSVAAARQIAAQSLVKPMVVVWPQHCSKVKESWDLDNGAAGETEGKLWGAMRAAGILLLDDVDKINTTGWAIQKLYEVIDYRVVHQRQTIITANHSPEQLRAIWNASKSEHISDTGAAIMSRIEGELFGIVEFTGKDQRRGQ